MLSLRSGSEVEFDAAIVARWPDTGIPAKVRRCGVLAERLYLGKLRDGMEFPVKASEPADDLWMVGEPGRTLLAGGLEFASLFLQVG